MKVTFNYWIGKVVEKNWLVSSRVSRALYHIEFFKNLFGWSENWKDKKWGRENGE